MSDATIYVNADRTILLTVWADGVHELALRDEHRRWLPPVTLHPESADTFVSGTGLVHEHDAYMCKQAGCLPVAAVQS